MLDVGSDAPSFTLPDANGDPVSLEDFRGKKVLIWFFPKASTPGCTAQGCNLRDNYAAFQAKNVVILGMSKDPPKRQAKFVDKYEFPFTMLCDESGTTIERYEAWGLKKFMGREFMGIIRSSYLIDEEGKIERTYGKVKTKTHGVDVLEDL